VADLLISIVTPTLNAQRYLAECLHSVQTQDWHEVEHLVVDGGSTDATEQLVRSSGATWISRPGLNQTAAINVGIHLARGELVAWLNSDDVYAPGCLRFVATRFACEPDLHVLIGDCDVIDADGKLLRRLSPGPYDYARLLRNGNSVAQPAVFLRRSVFEQVGYLDETLEFGMDYDLWLRLRGLHVAYTPRVLASFRWHSGSKTANNLDANWAEALRIVRQRHGGDWTPALVWAYGRARLTSLRQRIGGKLSQPR